jgi:hypothetical protein
MACLTLLARLRSWDNEVSKSLTKFVGLFPRIMLLLAKMSDEGYWILSPSFIVIVMKARGRMGSGMVGLSIETSVGEH